MPEWLCTYRLQINADFDFTALAEVAGYLSTLGVSHAYLSPILRSAPGSTHGYDVADATQLNPEWGGEEAYRRAAQALGEQGLGLLLDIVPNHMSIATPANPWWWDVLARGPASEYFHFFDFGWNSDRRNFRPLRLPVLEDRYARVLQDAKIVLVRTAGDLRVRYADWDFPIAHGSYAWAVDTIGRLAGSARLQRLAGAFAAGSQRELWTSLREALVDEELSARFDRGVERFNANHQLLHELLEQQNYRLAHWRTANESWFYRRFFDVNTLAGLRIEQEDIFQVRHRRELALAHDGLVGGLRIDHIDGLRYPVRYLASLRDELPTTGIWVEKILADGEQLPGSWPIQGTTGYDYLNQLNGLFLRPDGEPELTRIYQAFTGDDASFEETLDEAKREVVTDLFGGELTDLVELFVLAGSGQPDARDWARRDIEAVILEYIVALPVYRTYAEPTALSETDRDLIHTTVAVAAQRRPGLDPALFDFLRSLLSMQIEGEQAKEFVLRCQQLTGPAMAKGAEDTAFYRYARLLSLNEVGGSPARFGVSLEQWHAFCGQTAQRWPLTMVATSTHDTKRGEDARQRLNTLSEVPQEWQRLVDELRSVMSNHGEVPAPSLTAQYIFFQTAVGAWPLDAARAAEYMMKATREAKRETSWTQPSEEYDRRVEAYVRTALEDRAFTSAVARFVELIDRGARRSSLAQTVLKLTAPGLPDIYRGTEAFSYSLVDPDNRRPVDFGRLQRLLDHSSRSDFEASWLHEQPDLAKVWLTQRTLKVRREHASAFAEGAAYTPLFAEGAGRERAIACLRGGEVCIIAGRWFLDQRESSHHFVIELPAGTWRNEFTGVALGGRVTSSDLFGHLPAAILVRQS